MKTLVWNKMLKQKKKSIWMVTKRIMKVNGLLLAARSKRKRLQSSGKTAQKALRRLFLQLNLKRAIVCV